MTNIRSEDRTVEVAISPLGVVLRLLGHEWHWIISARDGALHLQGSLHPAPEGHSSDAKRPEDCPGCRDFLQPVIPSGGRQAGVEEPALHEARSTPAPARAGNGPGERESR